MTYCTYMYVHVHFHIHIYKYVYMYVYIYICVSVCACVLFVHSRLKMCSSGRNMDINTAGKDIDLSALSVACHGGFRVGCDPGRRPKSFAQSMVKHGLLFRSRNSVIITQKLYCLLFSLILISWITFLTAAPCKATKGQRQHKIGAVICQTLVSVWGI